MFSLVIFGIEYLIATVFRDIVFVRAYLGDVIVVWLLYTIILTVIHVQDKYRLANWILLFAIATETAQYFHIADKLGFARGNIMAILIGNSFSWWDILCYIIGVSILWMILFFERKALNSI